MFVCIGYEKIFRQTVIDVIGKMDFDTAFCASESRPWKIMQIQAQLCRIDSVEILSEFLASIPVKG